MIQFKKLHQDAIIPRYGSEGAAGLDLFFMLPNVPLALDGKTLSHLNTGIAVALPEGTWGSIVTRSSLAKNGLLVVGGVIDSDYRGEIIVMLKNLTKTRVHIGAGVAIAQMIIVPKFAYPAIKEVAELPPTERGEKGFGSTDKKGDNNVLSLQTKQQRRVG